MVTDIIVDMQLGSSGKGKFAQYLVNNDSEYGLYIKGGSINAGHTIYIGDTKVKFQTLPIGSCSNYGKLLLDASTITTFEILEKELQMVVDLGFDIKNRLYLDLHVGFITEEHIKKEQELINKIGSVGTGTGPARISRLERNYALPMVIDLLNDSRLNKLITKYKINIVKGYDLISELNCDSLIEGYQATHLDVLHSTFYPKCTSWGTTASALAWNAGVAPSNVRDVYGVFCPIMTRPGKAAGDTYMDSKELTWDEVRKNCGADIDLTEIAVTSGRVRRPFSFSKDMFADSQILNAPNKYALIRSDYIDWELKKGKKTRKLLDWIFKNISPLGVDQTLDNLMYISTGPKENEYIIL